VPRIGVLDGGGCLAQLVLDELARRGHDVAVVDVRGHVDLDGHEPDPRTWQGRLGGLDLVLSAVGRRQLTPAVLVAARDVGAHLVDVVGDPATFRWARRTQDAATRQAGTTAVLGAGFVAVPGDPLAHLAAHAVDAPRTVHVCYAFPGRGGLRAALSRGSRRALVAQLGLPGTALVDGEVVEELPGEARRLAWFPRPVGPVHAAGVPAPEAVTVPLHVPSVRTVRTSLALTSWRAELLQAAATLGRGERGRRWLAARLGRGGASTAEADRRAVRWACVAETPGPTGVARAWAYGTDPYGTGAASLVAVAEAILAGHADAGVVPPAAATVPEDLLDTLSARTDLRWSITRPSAG
jgi:short subunit dehydrogenase-like uncharacterized protein